MEKINRFEKICLLGLVLIAGLGIVSFLLRVRHPKISFTRPEDDQEAQEELLAGFDREPWDNIDEDSLFAYDEAAKYTQREEEDYLAKRKDTYQEELSEYTSGPEGSVAAETATNLQSSDDPAWGPEASAVTLVLFSDFMCPYCADFATQVLPQIKAQYGNRIRFIFRDLPIASLHPFSPRVHEAAECAHAQGLFWGFHDLIYANNASLTEVKLNLLAEQAGLEMNAFNACLASGEKQLEVNADLEAGINAGVEVTPTLFVNGRRIDGAPTFAELSALIEEAL